MKTPEYEFHLQDNGNGSFTILQQLGCSGGFLDYELELESQQEALEVLSQINWLEDVYSPPR